MGCAVPGVLHVGQRRLCLGTFLSPLTLGVGLQVGASPSSEDPVGAIFMAKERLGGGSGLGRRAGASFLKLQILGTHPGMWEAVGLQSGWKEA